MPRASFRRQTLRLRAAEGKPDLSQAGSYIPGMSIHARVASLSDDELLRRLSDLVHQSRRVEADLVAHIAEVDARRLYAREATSSMFDYCRCVLRLRENEAYLRITVARATREHPVLLEMLRDGRLHLSGIARLAPHLTAENRNAVLKRAAGLSHRRIQELVAELAPKPDAPSRIRKLPDPSGRSRSTQQLRLGAPRVEAATSSDYLKLAGGLLVERRTAATPGPGTPAAPEGTSPPSPASPPPRPARVEPLAPARYRVQFTASAELRAKLERLQALMRSSVPDGDLATVVEQAVTEKLERLEAKRFAKTRRPRASLGETDTTPGSRHIPAAVRRLVHTRDEGRCTYTDASGRRCGARGNLEFHHRKPYGLGGDHSPANISLVCRLHNQWLAERDYGREKMAQYRRGSGRVSEELGSYTLPVHSGDVGPLTPRRWEEQSSLQGPVG